MWRKGGGEHCLKITLIMWLIDMKLIRKILISGFFGMLILLEVATALFDDFCLPIPMSIRSLQGMWLILCCTLTPTTEKYTLKTAHYTLHISHCTLKTLHFIINTSYRTLHTSHFTQNTAHFTLHTAHFTLQNAHWTEKTSHFTLPLYTVHCIHHSVYSLHKKYYTLM